jgi:hypothetical protein
MLIFLMQCSRSYFSGLLSLKHLILFPPKLRSGQLSGHHLPRVDNGFTWSITKAFSTLKTDGAWSFACSGELIVDVTSLQPSSNSSLARCIPFWVDKFIAIRKSSISSGRRMNSFLIAIVVPVDLLRNPESECANLARLPGAMFWEYLAPLRRSHPPTQGSTLDLEQHPTYSDQTRLMVRSIPEGSVARVLYNGTRLACDVIAFINMSSSSLGNTSKIRRRRCHEWSMKSTFSDPAYLVTGGPEGWANWSGTSSLFDAIAVRVQEI